MAQTIDPIKLKAAAEHLEWVLQQFPDSEDVRSLLRSLTPLIEDAKAGRVIEPVGRMIDVPGAYNYSNGLYTPYKAPDVGGAYALFLTEMEGGLTEEDKQLLAEVGDIQESISRSEGHE